MSEIEEIKSIFSDILEPFTVSSHRTSIITHHRVPVRILEMEDVLFHHNSAVMMPSSPAGKSSADGTEDQAISERQQLLTGIRALSGVFRQYEFDNRLKIVVAGHTDTSGEDLYNFQLSDLRARNVLYLIQGNRNDWAQICYSKHKVEDYQQIMKYFFGLHPEWLCDPGEIDDAWGANTETATSNFFEANGLGPENLTAVKNDYRKKWPVPAWEVVFDLYQNEIAAALNLPDSSRLPPYRDMVNYVDVEKEYVACGEAFPIDDAEADSYRSQENRRVEILFFNGDESPDSIPCPEVPDTERHRAECPLKRFYINPVPISPEDFNTTAYHLKFIYFDRVKQSVGAVPEGLIFKVYEFVSGSARLITTRIRYSDGIYLFLIPDNVDRERLRFEIHFPRQKWIYTENEDSDPEIVDTPTNPVADMNWADRVKYYDLPLQWSSTNYWTREAEDQPDGERFDDFMTSHNIKPLGNETTSIDEPLIFSFDDIVLVNAAGSQNIRDKNASGSARDRSAEHSRLTLLYTDYEDEFKLKIHNGRTSHPYFSNIDISENLIHDIPPYSRLIIFCSDFYSIWDQRSRQVSGFDFDANHVLGARAAVLNDTSVHRSVNCCVNLTTFRPANDYCQYKCGNYELHYLHHCGDINNNPLSYLMVYWHCRFRLHSDTPATDPTLDANWRENFEREGMTDAMERTNRPYLLEKINGPQDIVIRPYHFYEAKLDERGGRHKCWVEVSKEDGAWMTPELAKFEQESYHERAGIYGTHDDTIQDVDGTSYLPLTSSHEFGHATGCFDDYLYSLEVGDERYSGIPSFSQPFTAPGGPYSRDLLARMYHNRSPRMRNFWHFINWINDESAGDLNDFLDGTTFKLTYTFTGTASPIEMDLSNNRYRDTCRPSYRRNNHTMGTTGRCRLLLYKTGGETSHTLHSSHVFDGILVVQMLFLLDFNRGFWDWIRGIGWDRVRRRNWIVQHILRPLNGLNRYYLSGPSGNDFETTIMIFRPFFWIGSSPPITPTYEIEVNYRGNEFEPDGNEIEVGNNVNAQRLIRYFIGKTGTGNVNENDLSSIATWMDRTLGVSGFSVERL